MITEASTADWVDFWENEEPPEPITLGTNELISLKEDIVEQIGVAASVWDWTSFEEDALIALVGDIFRERGIL